MATRWRIPPDSRAGGRWPAAASPTRSSHCTAVRSGAGPSTMSEMLRCAEYQGRRRGSWKTWDRRPSGRATVPPSVGDRPEMARRSVVFPAPEGPVTARTWPGPTASDRSSTSVRPRRTMVTCRRVRDAAVSAVSAVPAAAVPVRAAVSAVSAVSVGSAISVIPGSPRRAILVGLPRHDADGAEQFALQAEVLAHGAHPVARDGGSGPSLRGAGRACPGGPGASGPACELPRDRSDCRARARFRPVRSWKRTTIVTLRTVTNTLREP